MANTMHKQIFIISCLIQLFVLGGQTLASINYTEYHNEYHGFTIDVPKEWTVKQGVAEGTVFKSVHRDKDGYVSMVTVSIQPLEKGGKQKLMNTSPENLFELVKQAYGEYSLIMKLIDCGSGVSHGTPFKWFKHHQKISANNNKLYYSYYLFSENTLFSVSGSADYSIYPKLESILKYSVSSFRLKKNNTSTLMNATNLNEQYSVSSGSTSKPYYNQEYGFSINFPENWKIKGSGMENTLVKAVRKDINNRIALIAIAVYDIDMDFDIWEVTSEEMFEISFKNDYPNADANLLDSGKIVINGKHVIWTKIMVKNAGGGPMVSLSYHLIHNKTLFRISGSANTDIKWFEKNESIFKESISSIDFNKILSRDNYELKYPQNWTIGKEEVYNPDRYFSLWSPEDSSIYFVTLDTPINIQDWIKESKKRIVDEIKITEITTLSFNNWGKYQGAGLEIRGKLYGFLKGSVKLFGYSSTDNSFAITITSSDDSYTKDKEGFDLIESTFILKSKNTIPPDDNTNLLTNEPYINHKFNFSISFPKGWIIKKPISSESIAIKAIHRLEDGKFASINIYVSEIENNEIISMTAEELCELSYGNDAELLSSGEITINNNPALWMKLKINQEGLPVYAVCYVIVRDNLLFNIFGNTVLGGYKWFSENEELLEYSMKTFKFTN